MIGISICEDNVKAVRLSKNKKQYIIKQCYSAPLYEGDIIQGKLINKESLTQALVDIKNNMKINDSEEVYVGIPNGTSKMESLVVDYSITSEEAIVNNIPFMGNKSNFKFFIPFVSGNYKVIDLDKTEEQENDEKKEPQTKLRKSVSYCAISNKAINDFADIFTSIQLNVVSMENNALAQVRYLKSETASPFMIIDMEYDYTSFIIFSEKFGLFILNSNECGTNKLINYEYDEEGNAVDSSVNHRATVTLANMAKLTEKYYMEANSKSFGLTDETINEKSMKQIVFLNNDFPFVMDEVTEEFSNISIVSAQDVLPNNVSNKIKLDIMPDDLYAYYTSMVLVMNSKSRVANFDNYNENIEANLIPLECVENSNYHNLKRKVTFGLMGLTALSAIYMLSTVGVNLKDVYSNKDAEKVTPELKAKYEDAKKQEENMKFNILKYNVVSSNRKIVSPLVDTITATKPDDVFFTSINFNYKQKRIILECFTNNKMSAEQYLQSLKQNKEFADAQILSSQTRDNTTAFQINVPIDGGVAKNSQQNKNNKSTNNK